jgi:hypothetical protein
MLIEGTLLLVAAVVGGGALLTRLHARQQDVLHGRYIERRD